MASSGLRGAPSNLLSYGMSKSPGHPPKFPNAQRGWMNFEISATVAWETPDHFLDHDSLLWVFRIDGCFGAVKRTTTEIVARRFA